MLYIGNRIKSLNTNKRVELPKTILTVPYIRPVSIEQAVVAEIVRSNMSKS
jgi:hypothetical protein